MATVGHALIGLTGAALMPETAARKPRRLALLWPGIMVLLACALDLVEWAEVWARPLTPETPLSERHLGLVLAGSAVVGAGVAVLTRARSWWAVLVLIAVTTSHVLLDAPFTRALVAEFGGAERATEEAAEFAMRVILAEFRLYGLALVLAALFAATRAIPTGRTRRVAAILAIGCGAAAAARPAWVWVPPYLVALAYSVGALHALLRTAALWNLVLLAPVAALAIAHAEGARRLQQATESFRNRDQPTAVVQFDRALAMHTRRGREAAYGRMGEAYEIMGDFARAEVNYRKAIAVASRPGWYELLLARLYLRADAWGTLRADEARAYYLRLRDCARSGAELRQRAADELAKLDHGQPAG